MGRVLIVTWDGAGNLLSTLGIAQRLVEHGHDVRLLGHRSINERCGDGGWRFRSLEHTDFDSTRPYEVGREMDTLADELWFSGAVGADLLAELDREPADVVIGDCMLPGALSAAQSRGLPTVALFHTPVSGFRGGPMVEMLAPALPKLNEYRASLGLAPVSSMSDVHDACALSLVATPREFDVDMPLPDSVKFIGPVLDGPPINRHGVHLDVDDGPEPMVLVSFSTSFQGQRDTIQRVVDALGDADVSVVVTTGAAVAPRDIDAPSNTMVAAFAPHNELLPRASAIVTHAGLGTVMTALAHGVPLLCLPMGRDQFFNAAMVERLGAGRMLGPDADGATVRAALDGLLADGAAKDAAKSVAAVIAGYGGAADAVREVERLIGRSAELPTSV